MSAVEAFEPAKFLSRVNGSEYLEVKWRLVWLRDQHPDAVIETELVTHHGDTAVFRARVVVPGRGAATGWGSETKQDFRDYVEKAETKAIGRALAALGFGTQFCNDHDFGSAAGRVVDAPVKVSQFSRSTTPQNNGPLTERVHNGRESASAPSAPAAKPGNPPTEKQWGYLEKLRGEIGKDRSDIIEAFKVRYGYDIDNADRADLSDLIDAVKLVAERGDAFESILVSARTAGPSAATGDMPWDDLPPTDEPVEVPF